MANDDLLKCPLCQGRSQVNRNELTALLTDRHLREKIGNYLAEVLHVEEPAAVGAKRLESKDFEKDVHTWNPQMPIWRRSPKE
jgi:hypothetical protein